MPAHAGHNHGLHAFESVMKHSALLSRRINRGDLLSLPHTMWPEYNVKCIDTYSTVCNRYILYTTATLMAVMPSPDVRVAVAESLIRDLGRVSEWCDLWGMKLNASKTKTMIVSRSLTMCPQSPPLTIGGTVLKESDDLVILGVTFDSKMTLDKHLRSVYRAASQRLGILRKS